jgi:transcription elongation GreA/GreB family factor
VNQRLQTVENTISSNQNDLSSETKSSAGDKHETGRAMLQLEMEKAGQQLVMIRDMKKVLDRIQLFSFSKTVHLGSVVYTEKANFFISISAGELLVFGKSFFAISLSSPIGKLFLGKEENDTIIFNGNAIKIAKVE